jgi:hypothetical protein
MKVMRRNFLDGRREPGFDNAVSDLEAIEPHQSRWDVRFARDDENRLTDPTLFQHQQDSRGAPNVELREWIVEQQHRLGAGVLS